ncbi:MAG: 3-deoxy-manno-octulosonate cytidylyltransferase [Candidatus Dependentiae bacterium]|jgi:3-deoxy-manno-octulosonate cytidylyltransferase (CMP-KDO synthetase)
MSQKKIICVIPARLASTRLHEKLLRPLAGIPLLERVWRAASAVPHFSEVIIALDHPRLAQLVESFGGRYLYTSIDCPSGTDRLIEVMQKGGITGDIWVNWQADEPFITTEVIEDLLGPGLRRDKTVSPGLTRGPDNLSPGSSPGKHPFTQLVGRAEPTDTQILTLATPFLAHEDPHNPAAVKAVTDTTGRALYFSRACIPYQRNPDKSPPLLKHIGLYAYTTAALQRIAQLPPCPLAQTEGLEQLRFLTAGLPIVLNPTAAELHGIDTLEDFIAAEKLLCSSSSLVDDPIKKIPVKPE